MSVLEALLAAAQDDTLRTTLVEVQFKMNPKQQLVMAQLASRALLQDTIEAVKAEVKPDFALFIKLSLNLSTMRKAADASLMALPDVERRQLMDVLLVGSIVKVTHIEPNDDE